MRQTLLALAMLIGTIPATMADEAIFSSPHGTWETQAAIDVDGDPYCSIKTDFVDDSGEATDFSIRFYPTLVEDYVVFGDESFSGDSYAIGIDGETVFDLTVFRKSNSDQVWAAGPFTESGGTDFGSFYDSVAKGSTMWIIGDDQSIELSLRGTSEALDDMAECVETMVDQLGI